MPPSPTTKSSSSSDGPYPSAPHRRSSGQSRRVSGADSSPVHRSSPRTSGQPKGGRVQFSACGACRMRRVRCDLKDLPVSKNGHQSQCSNCKERDLKCIDEFAEVKAVKLLRRGRRLQQVEAIFGKNAEDDNDLFQPPSTSPDAIPKLTTQFFSSEFFRIFCIQYPIIIPAEFCQRYIEFINGRSGSLTIGGQLVAMLLVVWAASFGVDEYGVDNTQHGDRPNLRERKQNINEMVSELLVLFDIHGVMRKPSWDSVRALLLLLPLTEDVQNQTERMVMHETAMSQVSALIRMTSVPHAITGRGKDLDILLQARIFWHAYTTEGIANGLYGGRLVLTEDDLASFQKTLPSLDISNLTQPSISLGVHYRLASVPLKLASACRNLHQCLTGPEAQRRHSIDEGRIRNLWDTLEQCSKDLNELRHLANLGMVKEEDVTQYADAWQIRIFECYYNIRDTLKQRAFSDTNRDFETSVLGSSLTSDITLRLFQVATNRCHQSLKSIMHLIRSQIDNPFFDYMAPLVRDGTFFAGHLLAKEVGATEDVGLCIRALGRMRWAFSKREEKEATLEMVHKARATGMSQQAQVSSNTLTGSSFDAFFKSFGQSYAGDSHRALPPPISIPGSASARVGDSSSAPSTASTDYSNWTSPPISSASSVRSIHDDILSSSSLTGSSSPSDFLTPTRSPQFLSGPGLSPATFHHHLTPRSSNESLASPHSAVSSSGTHFPLTKVTEMSFTPRVGSSAHGSSGISFNPPPPSVSPTTLTQNPLQDSMRNYQLDTISPSAYFDLRGVSFPSPTPNGLTASDSPEDQHFASFFS